MDKASAFVRSPLGVCVLPAPPRNVSRSVTSSAYIREVLDHAGLCYRAVEWGELEGALPELRILVTLGDAAPEPALAETLREWVEHGGAWLGVGGVCTLPALFRVEVEKPSYTGWGGGVGNLGEGYLRPVEKAHPALSHLEIPLHFFNGLPVRAAGCQVLGAVLDAHQRATERVAFSFAPAGNGSATLIAPDLTGALVRIQQGTAVTRDGVSAPDGSAPVCDEVLKSDDGCVLDWIFDRQPVEGIPGLSAFLQPIADQWRELFLRALFDLATRHAVPLTLLWLYPRNLSALAHMSHDTDGNDAEKGQLLLEALEKADIRTTWCTILPGYPEALTRSIAAAGHELAMHYDAMTDGLLWSSEQFHRQYAELVELFGGERPVTNKNHYLRWEGDTELFDWCLSVGIELDQSKGASKTGEAGFNFGTCHPFFPVDRSGNLLDVLELPTPTQDLNVFAPEALFKPLLRAALKHHGIVHLLFHPAHIDKPGVAESLIEAARQAKAQGVEWWTGAQINRWERTRRRARWVSPAEGEAQLQLVCDTPLRKATVLVLNCGGEELAAADELRSEESIVTRWGFEFRSIVADLEPGTPLTIFGRTECQTS